MHTFAHAIVFLGQGFTSPLAGMQAKLEDALRRVRHTITVVAAMTYEPDDVVALSRHVSLCFLEAVQLDVCKEIAY